MERIRDYDLAQAAFSARFSGVTYPSKDQELELRATLDHLKQGLADDAKIAELEDGIARADALIDQLQDTQKGWSEVFSQIGLPEPPTLKNIDLALTAMGLSAEAPVDKFQYRDDALDDDVDTVLADLEHRLTDLKNRRAEINEHFSDYEDVPVETLRAQAVELERKSAKKLFTPRWWKARSIYRNLCSKREPKPKASRSRRLNTIATYLEDKSELERNSEFSGRLGALFEGMDTRISEILAVREWYKEVRQRLGYGFSESAQIGDRLISADAPTIRSIARLAKVGLSEAGKKIASEAGFFAATFLPTLKEDEPLPDQISRIRNQAAKLTDALRSMPATLVDHHLTATQFEEGLSSGETARTLAAEISDNSQIKGILSGEFSGVDTDKNRIVGTLELVQFLNEAPLPASIRNYIFQSGGFGSVGKLKHWHEIAEPVLADFEESVSRIVTEYELLPSHWLDGHDGVHFYDTFEARASKAVARPDLLSDWITYLQNRRGARTVGLTPIVDLIEWGKLPISHAENALGYLSYFPHAESLHCSDPYLSAINGDALDELRSAFTRYDQKIQELNKQSIAARLDSVEVPAGWNSAKVKEKTELALISHLLGLKRPRTSIRDLIHRAGQALQALKPCWMMGPLSVAQYLKPGEIEFDLLIMDEASQMKPEDAIGSIARAKQVVIVGDPKQLPPTDFFSRNVGFDEDDEELAGVEEAESILDAAKTLFQPARRLRWHYRSQSEQLIAFSNKNFYGDDLVVFPSPSVNSENLGITYEFVPDASCRKGRNLAEARVVAQRAIEFMESGTSNSLGVVAINSAQQMLIEEEFYRLLKSSPLAEVYLERRSRGAERFFIKNLENVQGDERDVIMISFTYGPDPQSGKVMNRFGPITYDTGWRRLNVLYTRAKKRVIVISSMRSDDIRLSAEGRLGPAALKGYLAYAESGQLEMGSHTGRDPDSDFEIAVADALRMRGYECVAQLGVAGYFLDIVVRHPDKEDSFILGIECDGATYHSAKSVRDRDRLRQLVLERLGWSIERIWSTDWFEDSDRQIDRICARIEAIREIDQERQKKREKKAAALVPSPAIDQAEPLEKELAFDDEPDTAVRARQATSYISIDEAREQLVNLRENAINIENPDADRTRGLLRNEMLECLLTALPTDEDEFRKFVPQELRMETDGAQLTKYGTQVFDILADVDI